MHEYAIVQMLLWEVEREARAHGALGIRSVRVRIGALSGVEVPLLRAAYETFRARTLCEGAELEVESVGARWRCPGCGDELAVETRLRCGRCERPARLEAGDEILLDRIELEVA